MKKVNKNSLLCIFVSIFLLAGIRGDCSKQLVQSVKSMLTGVEQRDFNKIVVFRDNVDRISGKNLSYHDKLMDLYSLKENLLGTRVIDKSETLVVKADSGTLLGNFQNQIPDEEQIEKKASDISKLQKMVQENGAKYLYCVRPKKTFCDGCPENVISYDKENHESLLKQLEKKEITYLDITAKLQQKNLDIDDIFFYTDHHWKPMIGFEVTGILCKEMNDRHGFKYHPEYLDIANYNVKIYENQFLGSYGKKVGTYFTWHGLDDFELITPKFETASCGPR